MIGLPTLLSHMIRLSSGEGHNNSVRKRGSFYQDQPYRHHMAPHGTTIPVSLVQSHCLYGQSFTWWFIPLSKWVITLVIKGISGAMSTYNQGYNPLTKWDEPPSRYPLKKNVPLVRSLFLCQTKTWQCQRFPTYSWLFSQQVRSPGLQVWNSIPRCVAQVSMLG